MNFYMKKWRSLYIKVLGLFSVTLIIVQRKTLEKIDII